MNYKSNKYFILLMLIAAVFTSCKNQWDKHNLITDPALNTSLLVQINQNPSLSLFSQYLVKTGYDKVISSSKTFTVWAPTNTAIQAAQAIDPTIVTDSIKLRNFIGNHISYQSYTTSQAQPSLRIKTLNGKSITFTKSTFEEANILQADQYVANGMLHVIDQAIIPKLNIWDYVKSLKTVGLNQKNYLLSQNYPHQDTTKATVLSIDPLTGNPIYDPNTGIDTLNHYLDQTQNLKSEDAQYTFFVLTDDAFNIETSKVSKFFKTLDPVASATATNFNVTKDLVIPGLYTQANLPDTLISPFNVKVPLNKNTIIGSYKASNGIVYIVGSSSSTVSGINFRLQDKFQPIVIQGENPSGFSSNSYFTTMSTRPKVDLNGVKYTDFLIEGALPAGFWVRYNMTLNSIQYKVYWRAINVQTANNISISQQINFGAISSSNPYTTVPLANYSEVFLSTITVNQYGFYPAYIVGSTSTKNTILLDYLKLVPVLQ